MATYYLLTGHGYEDEFEASSDREARQEAARRIRAEYAPWATSAYRERAVLLDEDGTPVDMWLEPIEAGET